MAPAATYGVAHAVYVVFDGSDEFGSCFDSFLCFFPVWLGGRDVVAFALVVVFTFVAIVALSRLGVIESRTFVMASSYSLYVKDSLGFFNPNPAGMLLFSVVAVAFLYGSRPMFWVSCALFLFFFTFLGARTYLLGVILLGLGRLIDSDRFEPVVRIATFVVLLVVPVALVLLVRTISVEAFGFFVLVDSASSGRLGQLSEAVAQLGQWQLFFGGGDIVRDFGILNYTLSMGVVPYAVWFSALVFGSLRRLDFSSSCFVFVVVLTSYFENYFSAYSLAFLVFLNLLLGRRAAGCSFGNENGRRYALS